MKRKRLNKKGKSDTALAKEEIQRLVREIVMIRDGGCVLKKLRHCNDPVLQADHLITRSNNATYADTRLIVCLCRSCHGGFKQWHKEQYDSMIRTILPKERVKLWDRCLQDMWRPKKSGVYDWNLAIVALNQELRKLSPVLPQK